MSEKACDTFTNNKIRFVSGDLMKELLMHTFNLRLYQYNTKIEFLYYNILLFYS